MGDAGVAPTESMRIIAGEFRSRQILAPKTDVTRPITDRVKQSLFDILAPQIEAARVYDCFAGTGSMGLECLSRGAAYATLFEADRSAVVLLRKNISTLGVEKRSTVIDRDLFKWFETTKPSERAGIIFLDPPYRFLTEQPDALRRLAERMSLDHLEPEGLIVFRHDAKDALELPRLRMADQRVYGSMAIELLHPDGNARGVDTLGTDDEPGAGG
jgi:16S rRNA (guanine(966)-N(2))-methyltransferase RsmD